MRLFLPLTFIATAGVVAFFMLAPKSPHWTKLAGPQTISLDTPSIQTASASTAPAPAARMHNEGRSRHYAHHRHVYRAHYVWHRHIWHRRWHRRYDWHVRQAEPSLDLYGYSAAATSHRYNEEGGTGQGEAHSDYGHGEYSQGDAYRGWTDGYGRVHAMEGVAQQPGSEIDSRDRLDPYHGYSDGWDER